jgi:hypothetical protein
MRVGMAPANAKVDAVAMATVTAMTMTTTRNRLSAHTRMIRLVGSASAKQRESTGGTENTVHSTLIGKKILRTYVCIIVTCRRKIAVLSLVMFAVMAITETVTSALWCEHRLVRVAGCLSRLMPALAIGMLGAADHGGFQRDKALDTWRVCFVCVCVVGSVQADNPAYRENS